MRTLALLAASLLALTVTATAFHPPSTGPYQGTVGQGETDHYSYDNNPHKYECIDVMVWYTVTLRYTPASDAVALTVGEETVVGSDGFAGIGFEGPACTAFPIAVTGVSVASVAEYTVTVDSGYGGSAA